MPEGDPLEGIRVLALTETVPGPLAAAILADLGAEVTVVERPGGDPARAVPSVFRALGRNKRFVVLDLRRDSDRAALETLLAGADVVLTGYRPDVARRHGLAPDEIRARHPSAVVVSVTAVGDDEPGPGLPAHDLSIQASAGLLDGAGSRPEADFDGAPIADLATGAYAAIAALSGLVAHGRGRAAGVFGVSMRDSAFAMNAFELTRALHGLPWEDGLRAPAGYGTYRCRDNRVVAVGVSYEAHHWAALCRHLGLPELARLTVQERVRRRDQLGRRISDAFATLEARDVVRELRAAGLPVELVVDADAIVASETFAAAVVEDPTGAPHLASPIVVDGRRLRVRRPVSAEPGGDADEVLTRAGLADGRLSG